MFKPIAALIVCVFIFATTNVYAGYDEDVAAINKDMPKQVKQFNKRQIECNHWSGEEPYDAERGAQINAAVAKLKCDALEKDEKKLLRKYKSQPDVIDSINKAKEFVL
jgi:hypothetical protein